MAARVHSGILPAPEPDLAAEMYDAACDALDAAGYIHYEISNWARRRPGSPSDPDARGWVCRHNLRYWRNLPYLGLGAGAHGSTAGFRYANVLSPQAYIQRLTCPHREPFPFSAAAASRLPIDRETEMRETLLMGLRLLEDGVPAGVFRSRFGLTPQEAFPEVVSRWQAEGLLELNEDRLRLNSARLATLQSGVCRPGVVPARPQHNRSGCPGLHMGDAEVRCAQWMVYTARRYMRWVL